MKTINGKEKIFFGTRKSDNARIYMTKPSFDCGWYWSFGYLGNSQEHYHLDSYQQKQHVFKLSDGSYKLITEKRNKNMYDCLAEDYMLNAAISDNLWQFCEQAITIYRFKEIAEIYHRGCSHFTTNDCKDIIKSEEKYKDIVFHVLPVLLQTFWDTFSGYKLKQEIYKP